MRFELTKRADYAVRAVMALARIPDGERRSVRQLASEQHIPARFLPQVMGDLVESGIVEGTVGRSGGYRLARPPSEISLLEIVESIEGDGRRRVCVLRNAPCELGGKCDVHEVFDAAQTDVLRRLRDTTVGATIDAAKRRRPTETSSSVSLPD